MTIHCKSTNKCSVCNKCIILTIIHGKTSIHSFMNSQKLFAVYNATSILAIPICLIGLYIVYSYINEVTPWLTLNIGLGTVIYEIYDKMSVFDVYQLNVNISSVILITPLFIHGYTDDININVYFIISFAIFPLFFISIELYNQYNVLIHMIFTK